MLEMVLTRILALLEEINADLMARVWKLEMERLYNVLMTVVVNDKAKSKIVSQKLCQCFNRLVSGPHEQFFIDLGIPESWYQSKNAESV
jgi:hypothetical protein